MELFTLLLFGDLLALVYHCFDRIVIHGYLNGLARPEQVIIFFRQVLGLAMVDKEVLIQRTRDYQTWVESYASNHRLPIEWAEKGMSKEDKVLPAVRRMEKANAYGVYFLFKSMEQGRTFRITVPKYPTEDPNYRILAHQRSRFTHYYFYIRDEVLGPIILRVASFFPFHATYWLNGHSFIEEEQKRANIGVRKNDNAFLAVEDVAVLQAAADRLSPQMIRQQLDYWTFLLGPKFSKRERRQMNLSRFYSIARILPQLHLQTPLSHPQNLRAQLRNRLVAPDSKPCQRTLRCAADQETPRQDRYCHRTGRARPSCLPCLLEERLTPTIREVLPLPAQRAVLEQSARLWAPQGAGSSRRGAEKVSNHHRSLCWLSGTVPQRARGLSPAPANRSSHHHRLGALSRHQNP